MLGVHLGVPVSQYAAGDLLGHVRDDGSDPDGPTGAATGLGWRSRSTWTVRTWSGAVVARAVVFDRYGEEQPGERPWFAAPILSGLPDRFRFVYLRWYIDKARSYPDVPRLTDAQVELLDLIDEHALDPQLHVDMDFTQGDIQWLANRTILHSRTAYEDDPATPRHLLRLWLTLHRDVVDGSGLGGIPVKAP